MSVRLINAQFLLGAVGPGQFPMEEVALELVIVGRSNVGKSSLLNALFGTRKLVKVAARPGKTQELNFFAAELVDEDGERLPLRFVDLPGYGYAQVSKEQQRLMSRRIQGYLETGRHSLAILLVDLKRGPSEQDLAAFDHLCDAGRAEVVVTKADQLSLSKRKPALNKLQTRMGLARPPLMTSAVKDLGIQAVLERIHRLTEQEA